MILEFEVNKQNPILDRKAKSAAVKIIQQLGLGINPKIEISPSAGFPHEKTNPIDEYLGILTIEKTLVIPRNFADIWSLVKDESIYSNELQTTLIDEQWATDNLYSANVNKTGDRKSVV